MGSEGWSLPHDAPIEIPVSASPAKGSAVAAIRMLSAFENPARVGACSSLHVGRLQSTSRHAAPSRWEVALQSRGARLFHRFVRRRLPLTRQAPETARRISGREAFASRPSTRRSAPEGFYDRFRSRLAAPRTSEAIHRPLGVNHATEKSLAFRFFSPQLAPTSSPPKIPSGGVVALDRRLYELV
jgi:hypothetical protein